MSWIQTYSGIRFDLAMPTPDMVDITDIAHALSHVCRFNGHVRDFYSVAQHAVLVARLVHPKHALVALLHDATEAYVGDVTRPLKALLPDYAHIEAAVWRAICAKFGLAEKLPMAVKLADNIALVTERRDLLGTPPIPWDDGIEAIPPDPRKVVAMGPCEAREVFLDRFVGLTEVGDGT